jgi:hypothetical protein
VAGEYIACALFTLLAWNKIVPPKDTLELYCEAHRGLTPGGLGSSGLRGNGRASRMFGDHQCPTYTQQMSSTSSDNPMTFQPGGIQDRSYLENSGPPFTANLTPSLYIPNKRGSSNTLSTISEVRVFSSPSSIRSSGWGAGGAALGGGGNVLRDSKSDGFSQNATIPSLWIPSQQQPFPPQSQHQLPGHPHGHPPPSATESIKSHWSDDSEDDKKGDNGLFTLVKSTRDSLTRKGSKGSRTGSIKGDKGGNVGGG